MYYWDQCSHNIHPLCPCTIAHTIFMLVGILMKRKLLREYMYTTMPANAMKRIPTIATHK